MQFCICVVSESCVSLLSHVLLIFKEKCNEEDCYGEGHQTSLRDQDAVPPTSRMLRDEPEKAELRLLLTDCGAESVSQLRYVQDKYVFTLLLCLYIKLKLLSAICREQVAKLRSEAAELRGLLKEEHATDSKESAESSGESDSHGDLKQTVKTLRSEAKSHRKIIRLLKEQLQQKSAKGQFNTELNVNIATEMEGVRTETKDSQRHSQTSEKQQQVKESKQKEKKETQEKEEKIQGQSTKLRRKQHMARHAVSVKLILSKCLCAGKMSFSRVFVTGICQITASGSCATQ